MKQLKGNWKLIWFMAFLVKIITLKLFYLIFFFTEHEHSSAILNHPLNRTFLVRFFSHQYKWNCTTANIQKETQEFKVTGKSVTMMKSALLPLKRIMRDSTRLSCYQYAWVKPAGWNDDTTCRCVYSRNIERVSSMTRRWTFKELYYATYWPKRKLLIYILQQTRKTHHFFHLSLTH